MIFTNFIEDLFLSKFCHWNNTCQPNIARSLMKKRTPTKTWTDHSYHPADRETRWPRFKILIRLQSKLNPKSNIFLLRSKHSTILTFHIPR